MAMDETLRLSFEENGREFFRIYGFSPYGFTYGRNQQPERLFRLDNCQRDGLSFSRRLSGGAVIYHGEELTYSLCFAPERLKSPSVIESYKELTGFLLDFYEGFGLKPYYAAEKEKGHNRSHICFVSKEDYDICIANRKIGGNAQRRTKRAVFQHGSIPIKKLLGDAKKYIKDVQGIDDAQYSSLTELGINVEYAAAAERLKAAFEKHFSEKLQPGTLSMGERQTLKMLTKKKKEEQERCFEDNTKTRLAKEKD